MSHVRIEIKVGDTQIMVERETLYISGSGIALARELLAECVRRVERALADEENPT